LLAEAQRHGLALACAPEHPVRPVIRTIADLVRDGVIGRVAFAKVQSSHDGPEKHDVPRDSTWYYQPGTSPILDLGVHGLSQITSILGPVRRLSCFSGRSLPVRVTTAGPFKGKRIDVEIDDNSLLMLDFGDATFSYLDATYCVEASLGPRLEIYGSEGTISLGGRSEGSGLRLYRSAEQEWRDVEVPPAQPVRDLGVLHTVEHLRGGAPLRLTAQHGRHLVEIMTRAPEAAATGHTLEMETTF
jgi:predicted dehydrogenase